MLRRRLNSRRQTIAKRRLWIALAWLVLRPAAAFAEPVMVPPQRLEASAVPYPPGAKGDALVVLVILVDTNGTVTQAELVDGPEPFAGAALLAVKGWRFAPATRDGEAVPTRITVRIAFREPPPASPPTVPAPATAPATAIAPATEPATAASPATATVTASSPATATATANEPAVVEVRGEREELGTNHIPRSETRFIPGAFGDPFRAIEALPGLAPWLSGLPYDYVRGSPPENVGYAIDGIRVPLLFHVGAGPSTIAPPLVDSVDLYPGGYPARFGRYAGAMVTGETTAPETDRVRAEAGARVFDAYAFGEVPIDSARGSVVAAARYAYTGPLISLVAPDYSVGYWDYQARASHRAFGSDTVSLFAFGSHDELAYKRAPTFRIEYHRVDLRYDHPLRNGNLRVAATFNFDDTFTALQTDTGAGSSASLRGPGGRIRAELDARIGARARLRAGADAAVTHFEVDDYEGLTHSPHTDLEGGLYADVVWRPSKSAEIVPGLRLDGYLARDQTAVIPQPRVAAKLAITPALLWISSMGVAHQEPTEEVFVPAKLPSRIDEAPRTSFQFSEALEARLPSSMRARVTAFYARLVATSVPGEEYSRGVELFVRRDFTQRLAGFAAYTLARTDTILGATTATANWDRTHLVSAVLGYDLGRGWRIGARFFFESGHLYSVYCPTVDCAPGAPSPSGSPASNNAANSGTGGGYLAAGRLPPFFRLDARLEKRWSFHGGQWLSLTFEGFNVLDKAEPIGRIYSPPSGLALDTQSPVILPSVGVEGGL